MQACFNDIRQVVCLGDELHLSAESSRHTNTQTFSQRHNYTDTQAYYFILRQNALFLCKVENILRNSLTDDILCRILPYILMFSWEILYSKDLLPSYHLAHHPPLPSIPPCLPYHPALHPTLPTCPPPDLVSHPTLPCLPTSLGCLPSWPNSPVHQCYTATSAWRALRGTRAVLILLCRLCVWTWDQKSTSPSQWTPPNILRTPQMSCVTR